ncbi:potassium-transporting ATPase subunit B [Salinivibrio sp. MA351]|uniref:potassium-transporting ATPase subunit KdpB n=1 Tax=Salinivibrio sp. MA351 TaxID=1909453 RepID=UPI00098993CD|nr:potassium-transporting ATPase subunit KdpB [Salinivibrio sp. MA351]OOE96271.1 potassium-transporting ATPase subunit B [Salinivibrio sp. MA351]
MTTKNSASIDFSGFKSAFWQAVLNLNPVKMLKSPVMFVVWVGAIINIGAFLYQVNMEQPYALTLLASIILVFTVWFSNFSESVAEEKSRGQAASLKNAKKELRACRLNGKNEFWMDADKLLKGDKVIVRQGEYIPADGEILSGVATVNESAVTGESAAVLREAGGDHSSLIGGTKILTGEVILEVANNPGESFLDRMIGLVEGASRKKTPNETALTVFLSALTIVFLFVVISLPISAIYMGGELNYTMLIALLVCLIPTTIGGLLPAIGIAGMNRSLAHNIVAKSGKAVEIAGDIDTLLLDKTGTITYGDRQATEFVCANNITEEKLVLAAAVSSLFDATPEGKSIITLAKNNGYEIPELDDQSEYIPFTPKTRISGLNHHEGTQYVKGASDAIKAWSHEKNLAWPQGIDIIVDSIAKKGGTPLVVATSEEVLGVIALTDVVKPGVAERFSALRDMGIKTIMVTGDNPVTAGVIAAKAGVDDFISEAKPEDKLRVIQTEQKKGRLIAMVGDGTNDAPALAQADIGLAMNSGTQAAKEAGNMVDLDSDPTKLLAVVEIGKQLLITRGALTTFSLSNDIAKYFAIIPAIFVGAIPSIGVLNFMDLHSPTTAVLSALIFNALIIPALIPLAIKGVGFKNKNSESLLKTNMLYYGLGGVILPFVAIKFIDICLAAFY